MWGNDKRSIICVTEVPEENKKEIGAKTILEETVAEIFPDLTKDINLQNKRGTIIKRINPKKCMP